MIYYRIEREGSCDTWDRREQSLRMIYYRIERWRNQLRTSLDRSSMIYYRIESSSVQISTLKSADSEMIYYRIERGGNLVGTAINTLSAMIYYRIESIFALTRSGWHYSLRWSTIELKVRDSKALFHILSSARWSTIELKDSRNPNPLMKPP